MRVLTIVAWIDQNAPDLKNLNTSGVNGNLLTTLSPSNTFSCENLLAEWALQVPIYLNTQMGRNYANLWLLANSANTAPPYPTIQVGTETQSNNYRLISDWGGPPSKSGGNFQVGGTPNPCSPPPKGITGGSSSQYNGYYQPPLANGNSYKVAEGRASLIAQLGYKTINNGRTLPFIWAVTEFTSSGTPMTSNHAIFPTYTIYVNGQFMRTDEQSPGLNFLNNYDQSNKTAWQKGPL